MPDYRLSVVIAKKKLLKQYNTSKSLSFDLHRQWREFGLTNKFRFTPLVHMINTLNLTINELLDECIDKYYDKYIQYNLLIRQK